MKLKLFIFFLIISAGVQAQIHQRIHLKDKTHVGIPIADIDSITNVSGTKTIFYKDGSSVQSPISSIDSINHAVPVTNSLYSVISAIDTLSQFKTGIDVGDLNPFPYALSGDYTALTPTNRTLTSLGLNTAGLSPETNNFVIGYHTLLGKINTADIPVGENTKYYTANIPADSVFITKTPTNVYVNGVTVNTNTAKRNIPASNGVVHEVSGFIFPPSSTNIYDEIKTGQRPSFLAGTGNDSIAKLVDRAALADPNIVNTLKTTVLTLMVPSNEAFATFLSGSGIGSINNLTPTQALNLLRDHMLINRKFFINMALNNQAGTAGYGGGLLKLGATPSGIAAFYVNTAAVIVDDFDYLHTNGVIHYISGILTK
jgi:uncharacterized surface protein with fasciclin (FAS1) repeats